MPILDFFLIFASAIVPMTKFISIMNQIKVFLNDAALEANKAVFERLISESSFEDLLECDILKTFRALFGKHCIVTITFMPL